MQCKVFIATSLDGFIARSNGDIDWLTAATPQGSTEDHGYHDFIAGIDVLVMGRGTFEKVLSFKEWPYQMPVVVLSTRLLPEQIPSELQDKVEIHAGPVAELVNDLKQRGVSGVYVDGGQVIQAFLREGWIDELVITRIPILLGEGLPLFGPLEHDVQLKHQQTKVYKESGFVMSTYLIGKE